MLPYTPLSSYPIHFSSSTKHSEFLLVFSIRSFTLVLLSPSIFPQHKPLLSCPSSLLLLPHFSLFFPAVFTYQDVLFASRGVSGSQMTSAGWRRAGHESSKFPGSSLSRATGGQGFVEETILSCQAYFFSFPSPGTRSEMSGRRREE